MWRTIWIILTCNFVLEKLNRKHDINNFWCGLWSVLILTLSKLVPEMWKGCGSCLLHFAFLSFASLCSSYLTLIEDEPPITTKVLKITSPPDTFKRQAICGPAPTEKKAVWVSESFWVSEHIHILGEWHSHSMGTEAPELRTSQTLPFPDCSPVSLLYNKVINIKKKKKRQLD